ncbi:MAG: radical SAM protein [Rhodospirillaceae bacterium]
MTETGYERPLWRPPSEGDNLIIQATLGCRYNRCGFCSMYKDREYVARPLPEVFADIDAAALMWPDAHRVFLADGDAYGLPTETLLALCARLRLRFPALQRVSAYATPFNISNKSADEIMALRQARLTLVYLGLESGSDRMLKIITKGNSARMEAALARANETGLKVSATVIAGLGGRRYWREHIEATAVLINRHPPNYLSTLQLMLDPAVAPDFFSRFEEPFEWQDDRGILEEMRLLIERLNPPASVIFRSNHASNALPLAGTLPKDRAKLLDRIDATLQGRQSVRPGWMRGL